MQYREGQFDSSVTRP
nr:unnamed protein product [Callosobruchus chinensis]CAH7764733.1 unnamed protein product [Callosobruchus chinensis]